jgi:hypothetical protein
MGDYVLLVCPSVSHVMCLGKLMMRAEECKQKLEVYALLGTLRCVEEFLLGLLDH